MSTTFVCILCKRRLPDTPIAKAIHQRAHETAATKPTKKRHKEHQQA